MIYLRNSPYDSPVTSDTKSFTHKVHSNPLFILTYKCPHKLQCYYIQLKTNIKYYSTSTPQSKFYQSLHLVLALYILEFRNLFPSLMGLVGFLEFYQPQRNTFKNMEKY